MRRSFIFLLTIVFFVFFMACDNVFYFPYKEFSFKEVPARDRELFIESSSGNKLHTYVFAAKDPKAVVLFFHGNARNISYLYKTFYWLKSAGYTYIVYDYSGYGKSTGSPSRENLYHDGIALLNFAANEATLQKKPFIVIGQSLGGAVLMGSLNGFEKIDSINLLVLDCTFPSYREVGDYHGKKYTSLAIGSMVISDEYEPADSFPKMKDLQILVSHCKEDTTVPFYLGEKIYNSLLNSKKEFWSFSCKHSAAYWKKENQNKLLKYFDTVLINSSELNQNSQVIPEEK